MFLVVVVALLLFGGLIDAQDTLPIHIDSPVIDGDGNTCPTYDQLDRAVNEHAETVFAMMKELSSRYPSCLDVFNKQQPSGYYQIQKDFSSPPVMVYCDMDKICGCNGTGGWMRVANLNMTDPNQQCPAEFRHVDSPRRSCGRQQTSGISVSKTFPVHGVEYSRVCGRVIGYQVGYPNAFFPFKNFVNIKTIDNNYIDGIILTHGSSPRKHIWSFVAAASEGDSYDIWSWLKISQCPCSNINIEYFNDVKIPPFIGHDYFCETGSRIVGTFGQAFTEDPLWDGQGCSANSTCCNHPLYFCKQLPQPTRDDIELRVCYDQAVSHLSHEDVPLEIVEIYVQ